MLTNRDIVLMAFLQCGTLDFSVLDDIGYDLEDIVDELLDDGIKPTLNAITDMVFRKGVAEMSEYVSQMLEETEVWMDTIVSNESREYEDCKKQLEELKLLNPDKDIEWYCNCLDTSVWFAKNSDIYREYLPEAVEAVEGNMGFNFGG